MIKPNKDKSEDNHCFKEEITNANANYDEKDEKPDIQKVQI